MKGGSRPADDDEGCQSGEGRQGEIELAGRHWCWLQQSRCEKKK